MKKIFAKIKRYFLKNKKIFAKDFCFDKLFLVFIIGSVLGTVHEQLWYMTKMFFKTGEVIIASRTALIYGPFNIIYGVGMVFALLIFGRKDYKGPKIFIMGALLGGAYEYVMSYLQEVIFGTISWDYSSYFLNINGRTTIPYMLFWGLIAYLFVKKIYPYISSLIEKIPYNFGKLMNLILIIFLIINTFLSISAVVRQNLRMKGFPPYTFIGEICDKYYTDEFLKKVYPNMKLID